MTDPTAASRFPMLYTGANKAMVVLGMRRENSFVEIRENDVSVQMGWAFRAVVPRSSITGVAEDHDSVWGWGAHGWRGRWLVNGSSSNIVRVDIDPESRARMAGLPVKLHTLRVSVEDPAGFMAALQR